MIKIDFIQFNFVLKKITKKTGKRGKPGEIFDLKHPVEENLDLPGMERGIINKSRDNGG